MTKQEFINMRNYLFNEDFSAKVNNEEEIKEFCKYMMEITGIQSCNISGYTNELLPKIYNSCLATLK